MACENVSRHMRTAKVKTSLCIRAWSSLSANWIVETTECMNGKQRSEWLFALAQSDLNLHILRNFEGTSSLNIRPMHMNRKGLNQPGECLLFTKILNTAKPLDEKWGLIWLHRYASWFEFLYFELTLSLNSKWLTPLCGPRKAKKCLWTCLEYADSDHPAQAQSIIRAFTLHPYIVLYPMVLLADSEGPDQIAQMRRLIWAFAVRICPRTRFWGSFLSNAPPYVDRVKWKSTCKHAWSMQIRITLRRRNSYILLYPMFQCAVKALIKLRDCASWSGPSLSAYVWGQVIFSYNLKPLEQI